MQAKAAQLLLPDLNRFEYELPGEFDKGSSKQYGEADINGQNFAGNQFQKDED